MTTLIRTHHVSRVSQLPAGLGALCFVMAMAYAATAAPATAPPTGLTAATEPSVLVFDQKIAGGQINVDYANLPRNGYVVIYSSGADGKPTQEPMGYAELKAGDHRNFKIKLNSTDAPIAGSAMWASIYVDADNTPGFSKGSDTSIWNDGIPSGNRFLAK
jgi:hypothetical protein